MGVPTFYRWLCTRFPKTVKDVEETSGTILLDESKGSDNKNVNFIDIREPNPNGEFDCLYLDMNGIIHPCAHPEDGEVPKNEEEMFLSIFDYVDRIVNIVRPRKVLFLSIDGVAPRAKMNQQRSRRFRAARDIKIEEEAYEKLKKQFLEEGKSIPARKKTWDHNVITPGTEFMYNLSKALQFYIKDRCSKVPGWKNLKVILSDAGVPGEGEHKLIQFIRSQRSLPDYDPNLTHIIHGADADLIMLGLSTHEVNFFVMREVPVEGNQTKCLLCNKYGHSAKECGSTSQKLQEAKNEKDRMQSLKKNWKPCQMVQISTLREYLYYEFEFPNMDPCFEVDKERCIDDFVFLCFLCGNDFLPHLPSLSIQKGSIDMMLELYKQTFPQVKNYLTNKGIAQLDVVQQFVSHIAKVESDIFKSEIRYKERSKRRRDKQDKEHSQTDISDTEFCSNTDDSSNELPSKHLRTDEGKVEIFSSHSQDIDDFKERMKNLITQQKTIEEPVDSAQLGVGDDTEWRTRYYKSKFRLTNDDDIDQFAKKVVESYYTGLQWVLTYYSKGCPSWRYYYPFHFAPFASDLAKYTPSMIPEHEKDTPINPIEQLMAVLPPDSGHCLPPQCAELMTKNDSPIIDFYPIDFDEDPDGKRYAWQWVVLLPFIHEDRLLSTLRPIVANLKGKHQDFNRLNKDLIFFHHDSKLGTIAADLTQKQILDVPSGEFPKATLHIKSQTVVNSVISQTYDNITITHVSKDCVFTFEPKDSSPIWGLLPNANLPSKTLSKADLHDTERMSSRYNAVAARRMICNALGVNTSHIAGRSRRGNFRGNGNRRGRGGHGHGHGGHGGHGHGGYRGH